jgi:hypothetical protein
VYVAGECSRAQKKGRSKMVGGKFGVCFFVADEYGNQITEDEFTSYSAAEKAARELSKQEDYKMIYITVNCFINSRNFRNGKWIK